MKNFVFILVGLVLFISCSSDPREQIISDYEQTTGDTKTDLSLRVIRIINLGSVTANDSLSILEPEFIRKRDEKIESIKESIIQDMKDKKEFPSIAYIYDTTINISNRFLKLYSTNCKGTFLEDQYNRIQEFKKDTSKIIYNKAKVTYSIKNPMMNYAKQEITKIYMFSSNNDSIIGVIQK